MAKEITMRIFRHDYAWGEVLSNIIKKHPFNLILILTLNSADSRTTLKIYFKVYLILLEHRRNLKIFMIKHGL